MRKNYFFIFYLLIVLSPASLMGIEQKTETKGYLIADTKAIDLLQTYALLDKARHDFNFYISIGYGIGFVGIGSLGYLVEDIPISSLSPLWISFGTVSLLYGVLSYFFASLSEKELKKVQEQSISKKKREKKALLALEKLVKNQKLILQIEASVLGFYAIVLGLLAINDEKNLNVYSLGILLLVSMSVYKIAFAENVFETAIRYYKNSKKKSKLSYNLLFENNSSYDPFYKSQSPIQQRDNKWSLVFHKGF